MNWPKDFENKILQGDCLQVMKQIPSGSVDCTVSSPPYNVGIDYGDFNDEKQWKEYRNLMEDVLTELFRITRNGGRVCWNIPSFSSRQNLYFIFQEILRKVGFFQYAEIIWDKGQISSRTAWGSFASASEPNILPSHEYILVFYKGEKNHGVGENTISKENFIKWTDGMWSFTPETNSEHPAPFPIELPQRCIEMFSYKGETIFDPFIGSGTTALAAKKVGRKYIGVELSEKYVRIANERLAQEYLL